MQSTLNPNVKPFPAYIPSPIAPPKTLSNSNSNSTSPPSMASSWSTHHSRSPNTLSTPFPTYQVTPTGNGNGNGNGTDVKQFGQGWKNTTTYNAPSIVKHNASMTELNNHTHHNHNPIRTRSPSMPDITSLNILGESDPIVPFQSRDRYKHLQVPTLVNDRERVSKYDSVNGHSYNHIHNHNHNHSLGHVSSIPDLVSGYHNQGQGQGQGYRRSSLVTSWRNNIPEDSEVEHHTPTHGRFEIQPQIGQDHTLVNSRSVPAFATGAIAAGLSPTGQPTQSRNSKLSLPLEQVLS